MVPLLAAQPKAAAAASGSDRTGPDRTMRCARKAAVFDVLPKKRHREDSRGLTREDVAIQGNVKRHAAPRLATTARSLSDL